MAKNTPISKLDGPFSWHAYLGGALVDAPKFVKLRVQLEKRGLKCCLKYSPEQKNTAIASLIQTEVNRSQKCLLYLTPDYKSDLYYKIETQNMLTKTNRFSKDMVILLVDEQLGDDGIPEELRGLNKIPVKEDSFSDDKFIDSLAANILKEPSAILTVLPKENVGYGSAFGYFYGFLRLVLPDFQKRLFAKTLENDLTMKKNAVAKMLIIMPESCFCSVQMETPGKIEFTNRFVVLVANRAGNKQRDYKSSLFKLHDSEHSENYYFVGELATPLLTMFEMQHFNLAGMTKDQLYMERDAFYFALKAILSHPDNKECNDQFRLLYWCDPATNSPNSLELYDFLLPVVREEVLLTRENLRISEKVGSLESDDVSRHDQLTTYEQVPVTGTHPGAIYELLDHYKMDSIIRGKCLIINIANFSSKSQEHLTPRRGSHVDAANLKDLFKQLRFEVEVHEDVDSDTLEHLLLTTHLIDHSRYDAFICCILTHGKLGVVYTSDGKPIPILSLTEFFSDRMCPSLIGKPKMFFIQACQRGSQEGHQPSSAPTSCMASDSDNTGEPPAVDVVTQALAEGVNNTSLSEPSEVVSNATAEEAQIGNLDVDASKAPSLLDLPTTWEHRSALVPGSPDFLMSYSTLPGSISYRDTLMGSLYVQALTEKLKSGHEIDRALKMISAQTKALLIERGQQDNVTNRFQLPFHLTSGMDKLIYF